ncbi:hypothetical protein [Aquimarina longa]|uniref:hypothetical protein n=1 Tax=Aquimarina longa TaxID=1080221 RepID=UPI00078427FE|nr:hypothetical protein [Aquimarina longa]
MDLGCRIIPYRAYFTVRNMGKNLANTIEYQDTFVTGGGHQLYKNAFVFKGSTKDVIIISVGNEQVVKYIKDFIWDF